MQVPPNKSQEAEAEYSVMDEIGEAFTDVIGGYSSEGSGSDDKNIRSYQEQLAKAKVIGSSDIIEKGSLFVEKGSIYGAVVLMPQLARSLDWPHWLTVNAVRSYLLFALDLFLQSLILMMLAKHEVINDTFAGEMFLCDMGAGCNGINANSGATCTGPAGTNITPPRLYSYDIWSTRVFVKQSLQTIFPDQAKEIGEKIDPGEFGIEDYWCRLLCCFLFIMTMWQELSNIIDMAELFWYVPAKSESWVGWEDKEETSPVEGFQSFGMQKVEGFMTEEAKQEDKEDDEDWWEKVDIRIAGMSRFWKVFNVMFVLFPKFMVWKLTAETGVMFLMETAAIDDLIVNSVALTFVLAISEMVCQAFTSETTHEMLHKCQDYPLYDREKLRNMDDEEILKTYGDRKHSRRANVFDILRALLPPKVIAVLLLTAFGVWHYYQRHCYSVGFLVYMPNPLYLAKSTTFTVLHAFLPSFFQPDLQTDPEWTMPSKVF